MRPVDEGLGSLANGLDPILGEEVDRALTFEESVLGMEPLTDAPGGERVREQERQVAKLSEPVVPVGTDVARPPTPNRSVRDVGDRGDVDLGDTERLQGLDDLTGFDCSVQGGSHIASSHTSGSASSKVPPIAGPDNHVRRTKPTGPPDHHNRELPIADQPTGHTGAPDGAGACPGRW